MGRRVGRRSDGKNGGEWRPPDWEAAAVTPNAAFAVSPPAREVPAAADGARPAVSGASDGKIGGEWQPRDSNAAAVTPNAADAAAREAASTAVAGKCADSASAGVSRRGEWAILRDAKGAEWPHRAVAANADDGDAVAGGVPDGRGERERDGVAVGRGVRGRTAGQSAVSIAKTACVGGRVWVKQ
jgi:hypothetical protein